MSLIWVFAVSLAVLYVSILFTTVYLHRYVTHESFRLHPAAANAMHLYLALTTGIVPREWAAVHRKHHQFTDRDGDPHSPKLLGLWTVLLGNYFFYIRVKNDPWVLSKYTPHYEPDWIDRIPYVRRAVWVGMVCFVVMFWVVWGWVGLIWGFAAWILQLAAYVLLNSAVNSLGHQVGYKNFDNGATNLRWLAWLTGGEGLHNNHHEFAWSPRLSVPGRWEFDPGWLVIRLLVALKLAELDNRLIPKTAQ